MKKSSAVEAFGTVAALAAALGVTRQAIYQWPDELPESVADRVRGAALRTGKAVPEFPVIACTGSMPDQQVAVANSLASLRSDDADRRNTDADRRTAETDRRDADRPHLGEAA